MDEFDIPIFRKSYDLYKTLHSWRSTVSKFDRYTLWQRIESLTLAIIERLVMASQRRGHAKQQPLQEASAQLTVLRFLVRLSRDTKIIDLKKYAHLQLVIDELGRMLGGWLRSLPAANSEPSSSPPNT